MSKTDRKRIKYHRKPLTVIYYYRPGTFFFFFDSERIEISIGFPTMHAVLFPVCKQFFYEKSRPDFRVLHCYRKSFGSGKGNRKKMTFSICSINIKVFLIIGKKKLQKKCIKNVKIFTNIGFIIFIFS